jgi:hypothetical protein
VGTLYILFLKKITFGFSVHLGLQAGGSWPTTSEQVYLRVETTLQQSWRWFTNTVRALPQNFLDEQKRKQRQDDNYKTTC